jgi:hypothetical protein
MGKIGRRHLVIPDAQVRPGVDTSHIDWAARAILKYRPEVIIVLGDWWDLPSLSTHDAPGSKEAEGRRLKDDIDAGVDAFERLVAPMQSEQLRLISNRKKRWEPVCHFLFGNHCDRMTRAIFREPKYGGVLTLDSLKTPGFIRHDFLKIVDIDGIAYSHYFQSSHSARPIGGSIDNRLNKIGRSFVAGHEQGLQYGIKQYPGSLTRHGLVCGSFYLHDETYRGPQGAGEWRGIVVLNEVQNGCYNVMPLGMDYLRQTFG